MRSAQWLKGILLNRFLALDSHFQSSPSLLLFNFRIRHITTKVKIAANPAKAKISAAAKARWSAKKAGEAKK